MSGSKSRPTRDSALEDALVRIRRLERLIRGHPTPNVHMRQDLNGVTITKSPDVADDTQRISFGTLLLPPIDNGGTLDTNVFELDGDGPWDQITILEPGLYWGEARMGWFRDWGRIRINLHYEHTNGEPFPISDFYGYGDSLPTESSGDFWPIGTEPSDQTVVVRRGWILIDEYTFHSAGVAHVYTTVTNKSGSNHTFNNTDRIGGALLGLIKFNGAPDMHAFPPLG